MKSDKIRKGVCVIYAISDLHGCYEQYISMLQKISFSPRDTLYVVGDVVDRGPEPMKLLQDMSMRPNVIPILGNHDHMAYDILSKLLCEFNEENICKYFNGDLMNFVECIGDWTANGGEPTYKGFGRLSRNRREYLLEYLSEFSLYEFVRAGDKQFILTHSGLPEGADIEDLGNFNAYDFTMASTDYQKRYFNNIFLVTGHLPTFQIDEKYRSRIYRKDNHIAIDTGAVFGERMSCICLDTFEEFYI